MHNNVTTITNIVNLLTLIYPKFIDSLDKNEGTSSVFITFGSALNIINAKLSNKKLTPIAVISADILGEFLSGLYAK